MFASTNSVKRRQKKTSTEMSGSSTARKARALLHRNWWKECRFFKYKVYIFKNIFPLLNHNYFIKVKLFSIFAIVAIYYKYKYYYF